MRDGLRHGRLLHSLLVRSGRSWHGVLRLHPESWRWPLPPVIYVALLRVLLRVLLGMLLGMLLLRVLGRVELLAGMLSGMLSHHAWLRRSVVHLLMVGHVPHATVGAGRRRHVCDAAYVVSRTRP